MGDLQMKSKGDEVKKLQHDLKYLKLYKGRIDGVFGRHTKQAVADFQTRYFVDGIVDLSTSRAIQKAVKAWSVRSLNILLTVPESMKEFETEFGKFEWKELSGGYVEIVIEWVRENIVFEELPIVGKVHVHKKMLPIIISVLKDIKSKGLDGEIYQFGCWSARHKMHNPRRSLSIHSWGCAFDINWATNMPGRIGDIHPGIVASFERHGFNWGGRWNYRDDMHFQYLKG